MKKVEEKVDATNSNTRLPLVSLVSYDELYVAFLGVAQHTEGGEEREKAEHLALRTRCVEIWRERP